MLTIALEPEVAALFVKYVPVDKRVDGKVGEGFKTFASGSKYIVIDAGGTPTLHTKLLIWNCCNAHTSQLCWECICRSSCFFYAQLKYNIKPM